MNPFRHSKYRGAVLRSMAGEFFEHTHTLFHLFVCREFLDLKRNQQLLRELVTRRGLPVLDSIPSALQQTRAILDGSNTFILPHNVASRLM